MAIDLHTHTTASDGILSPPRLVAQAAAAGIGVLGVTDHDTLDGASEAAEAGQRVGVRVIQGVEVSAVCGGDHVHILGYFFRPPAPPLAEALARLRAERARRLQAILARLAELGYQLDLEDVLAEAGDARSVGRPHVARALVRRGVVSSTEEAFARLLHDGGPADVPRRLPSPPEAVRMIREAGGVAALAHPGLIGRRRGAPLPAGLIEELAAAGLAAVEADHPEHPPAEREQLRALASRLGLVVIGGSDFHTPGRDRLGACTTAPEAFSRLESWR